MPLLSLQQLLKEGLAPKAMLLGWGKILYIHGSMCLYFLTNRLTQWKLIILLGQRPFTP